MLKLFKQDIHESSVLKMEIKQVLKI